MRVLPIDEQAAKQFNYQLTRYLFRASIFITFNRLKIKIDYFFRINSKE